MLSALFSLSALWLFPVALIFGGMCLAISILALRLFGSGMARGIALMPVPTFMGAVTTAWALAFGFAAADIWSVRSAAEQAASEERSAISRLAGTAEAMNFEGLLTAVAAYKIAVIDDEWHGQANAVPMQSVDAAIQRIRVAIISLGDGQMTHPLLAKTVPDFDELQDARNKRLAIGGSEVAEFKWYLVLFLTLLSMIAIASVHADRRAAGYNALAIFATAAVVSLWILAIYATPYKGTARLEAEILRYPITSTPGHVAG